MKSTAFEVLEKTSRTFFIPISKLEQTPKLIVGSFYLCLRAIDQIQDHPTLSLAVKEQLLRNVSFNLIQFGPDSNQVSLTPNWEGHDKQVTTRLGEWIMLCPQHFRARIADSTGAMADKMANWAKVNWKIQSKADLEGYTMSVAGVVGLSLSEIWLQLEGIRTDRTLAVEFGRGLQAVNILRNKSEDGERGVSFYPPGWTQEEMIVYAREKLQKANKYMSQLPEGSQAHIFCSIPLGLAKATVEIIASGGKKLTREQVVQIAK